MWHLTIPESTYLRKFINLYNNICLIEDNNIFCGYFSDQLGKDMNRRRPKIDDDYDDVLRQQEEFLRKNKPSGAV